MLRTLLQPVFKWYIKRFSQKSLPNYDGELKLSGLVGPVEIIRDQWGVPHLYAQNQEDLFFAQGWVHAQDRLWQMELNRRVASGRIAEFAGEEALNSDRALRTLGMRRLAEKDAQRYAEHPVMRYAQRYAEGINAFVEQIEQLPVEFKLLKLEFETWTVVDTLAIARLLGFQMSFGWLHEIERLRMVHLLGQEKAERLFPQYPAGNPSILPKGAETNRLLEDGRLEAFKGPYLRPIGGSNNWTVAEQKMEGYGPVLCNDPHLPLSMPNIWYENHLNCPDYENTGVSLAGAPFVIIGHNRRLAWGATLSFCDNQDTFIERFISDKCLQYRFDGRILKSERVEESIVVKKRKQPHVEHIIYTHHGPVISSILEDAPKEKLSLCSPALQEDNDMLLSFYELNVANDWDDFVAACRKMYSPSLSLVYADTSGNTGYYVTGMVPKRQSPKGLGPSEGWSGKHEWVGRVPFEEMPHAFNPKKGYLFTCNHRLVDDNYPHDLGHSWMNGYRAKRLEQLFQSKERYSVEDFKAWQLDKYCIPGKELADLMVEKLSMPLAAKAQKGLDLLKNWDGFLDVSSVGGCVYQVVKQALLDLIFKENLSEQAATIVRGKGPKQLFMNVTEWFGHDSYTLLRLLREEDPLLPEPAVDCLHKALERAVLFLEKELGRQSEKWQWGNLHKIRLQHAFHGQKSIRKWFDYGPYPVGGDTDTLCQTAFLPEQHYGGVLSAASYRQIVNLGNLNDSWSIMPPGQVANSESPYYSNQFEDWREGRFKPMLWGREQVKEHSVHRLLLLKA